MSDASTVEELRSEMKSLKDMFETLMKTMSASAIVTSGNLSLSTSSTSKNEKKTDTVTEEHDTNSDSEVAEINRAEVMKLVEAKKKKMTPIDLLKINQACELKVTETLKLKSDKPSDVLSYKVEVENYLKSIGVLFAIDENEIDGNNPFLLVESEVRGKVQTFLLDSWPEDVRTRYRKLSNDDPRILWTLLIEDS